MAGETKDIGFWRHALLRSKRSLPEWAREWLANRWLDQALRLTDQAKALHDAAREIDPVQPSVRGVTVYR